MSTIQTAPALQLSKGDAGPMVFATGPRDRSFWLGLAGALAVHGLVFIGIAAQAPRTIGSPGGSADAINIDLVDDAELQRSTGVSAPRAETPPSDTPPAEQPPAEAPPSQAQAAAPLTPPQDAVPDAPKPQDKPVLPEPMPVEAGPAEPLPPEKVPPPEVKTKQAAKPAEPKLKSALPVDDKDLADLLSLAPPPPQKLASAEPVSPNRPESKPEKPQKQQKPEQAKPAAAARPKIDLSLPSAGAPAAGNFTGKNAGFSRPEGITRSGENDDFARGVIRALRNTMPEGHGTRSRLTVRITLSEIGNIAEVRLVHTSTDPTLDQNVMFSIRQSNFPIPPGNLKPVDRVFLVTYVYN